MVERTKKHNKAKHSTTSCGKYVGVCVAAVLDYFGIPIESYGYTSTKTDRKRYMKILEENGFDLVVDNRFNGISVAQALKRFKRLDYKGGDRVVIISRNRSKAHMLLVNASGYRVIDTAPRCRHQVEEMVHVKRRNS